MMKKTISRLLVLGLVLIGIKSNLVCAYERSTSNVNKDIETLNSKISFLAESLPYEGLYYYQIRELLKSYNIDYMLEDNVTPDTPAWFADFNPKNDRLITAKDLIIPPFTGSDLMLSNEEKLIAENFSLNYICKSEGDVLITLMYESLAHAQYLAKENGIEDNVFNMFKSGIGGFETFTGSDEVKEMLMAMPEFNRADLVKNEAGYYSNYKFLEKVNEKKN